MIYEGGRRIPGAEEEGAVAGEVIGEGEQNRWWQYNAHMWHCTVTFKKARFPSALVVGPTDVKELH